MTSSKNGNKNGSKLECYGKSKYDNACKPPSMVFGTLKTITKCLLLLSLDGTFQMCDPKFLLG